MPATLSPGPFPSWDDYRYFLATSEAGSFTKAAGNLGVTQSTLSRRIEHLEQQLGVRLFVRSQSGVALTTEGKNILGAAREIEAKILEIQGSLIGSDKRLEGTVRISVTDGLATFWMAPRLADFQMNNPGIAIEFQCSIEPADALRMEAELSIQSEEPDLLELISVKLGTLHFMPWASTGYLERHGEPRNTLPQSRYHAAAARRKPGRLHVRHESVLLSEFRIGLVHCGRSRVLGVSRCDDVGTERRKVLRRLGRDRTRDGPPLHARRSGTTRACACSRWDESPRCTRGWQPQRRSGRAIASSRLAAVPER